MTTRFYKNRNSQKFIEIKQGPERGGGNIIHSYYDSAPFDLSFAGAATSINANIPAGAVVTGAAIKLGAEFAGIDSTTMTLALTGGSSATVMTFTTFTSGYQKVSMCSPAVCTSESDLTLTLSGGADNTPSAGSIQELIVYYSYIEAIS